MPVRAAYGGYGYRGMPVRAAYGGVYRGARIAPGYGYNYGRRWAGNYPYHRHGFRRGWGWGFPLAAGVGLAAATSYYDSCWRYDGWQWVNVCYAPSSYYSNVYYD